MVFREEVGVSVVVAVLDDCLAVFRNCGSHEFSNHAAEVGRHHEGFEPLNAFGAQLAVDEAKEVDEINHCLADMLWLQAVWDDCVWIESVRLHWGGGAGTSLFVRHPCSPSAVHCPSSASILCYQARCGQDHLSKGRRTNG